VLYVFQIHGPYSQLNPVKWLANISGVALVIGSALMIKSRMAKKDQVSSYKDWYLLWLVFGLGASGMLTEMTRLANIASLSYTLIFYSFLFLYSTCLCFCHFQNWLILYTERLQWHMVNMVTGKYISYNKTKNQKYFDFNSGLVIKVT